MIGPVAWTGWSAASTSASGKSMSVQRDESKHSSPTLPHEHRSPALRYALVYVAVGLLWITFSDALVEAFPVSLHEHLQTVKGFGFVVVTGLLFFWLMQHGWARQHRAEQGLRENRERFELAARGANDGIWDWPDLAVDRLWWSPRLKELLGYGKDDLEPATFRQFREMVHADDLATLERAMDEHLRHGLTYEVELRLKRRDGHWIWVRSRGTSIRDADGKPVRMAGSVIDITPLRLAMDELAQQREQLAQRVAERTAELERAVRVKDQFLANMSHELRTPLNGVLVLAESLAERVYGDLTERQVRCVNGIVDSGQHLLELINDVLDLAKIDADMTSLEMAAADPARIVSRSISLVKDLANRKQISIDEQVDPTIPTVLVDKRRMRQMLVNLLSNAIKFTPAGGRITVSVRMDADVLVAAVSDTGIGIHDADLAKLFRPFVQVDDQLSRQHEGTGLGLALVKRLVELHGGTVSVESTPGKGSTFTLRIPQPEDSADEPSSHEATRRTSSDSGLELVTVEPGKHLLLVDDNETNREATAEYLGAIGHQVTQAASGPAALEALRRGSFDVMLLDVQLPEMDGLEVAREVRKLPGCAELPIVMLTALAMADDRKRCLEAGANDYLAKPFTLANLRQVLARWLGDKNPGGPGGK